MFFFWEVFPHKQREGNTIFFDALKQNPGSYVGNLDEHTGSFSIIIIYVQNERELLAFDFKTPLSLCLVMKYTRLDHFDDNGKEKYTPDCCQQTIGTILQTSKYRPCRLPRSGTLKDKGWQSRPEAAKAHLTEASHWPTEAVGPTRCR